jgi:hypothetical protein
MTTRFQAIGHAANAAKAADVSVAVRDPARELVR